MTSDGYTLLQLATQLVGSERPRSRRVLAHVTLGLDRAGDERGLERVEDVRFNGYLPSPPLDKDTGEPLWTGGRSARYGAHYIAKGHSAQ
jgi:hypothetical protein